jgi:formylglycine-generating enzyme required for sulfatase activity
MTAFYYRFRGCSWFYDAQVCRLANRFNYGPGGRDDHLGFRIFQRYE